MGLGLTTGPLHAVLFGGVFVALAVLFLLRRDRRWWFRVVPTAFAVTAGVLALSWTAVDVLKSWPDPLSVSVLAWVGAGELALVLLLAGWRNRRWRVRAIGVAAVVLAVAGAANGINTEFDAYPTVGTALQQPPYDSAASLGSVASLTRARTPSQGPLWLWHPPADLAAHGAVFHATIPAAHSHFAARPAWVYVPPAYLTRTAPRLPLLVMLSGQPGGPRDWLDGGRLAERMDAWARTHHGLAPVVVMPDNSGGEFANPLCMDSALGKVDTYLTSDVLPWAVSHFQLDTDHRHWAVGGLSSGGTCALQLATAHPDLFPTFFDASGQRSPSLGNRRKTVAAAFGGNDVAFARVDPLHELATNRYPFSGGYFVVGSNDPIYRTQQEAVAAAARASGMAVVAVERPGRHSYLLWGPAFSAALPWLGARLGLTA
jgi:S-formylglutathione hydrolase FrmB